MTTLALDLATTCGFAILREDGRIVSGAQSFAPRTVKGEKERPGARWVKFRAWLVELHQAHQLTAIAYEEVNFIGGPGGAYAVQVYGGFVAVMQHFCEGFRIPYAPHGVGVIKQAWTGRGNASKDDMVARCRELGFKPIDDNEADAIALLHVATNSVPKLPPERMAKKPKAKPNPDTRTKPMQLQSVEPPF
jgi:Holliday junction resolvasome RuvABC endonuclease subunit